MNDLSTKTISSLTWQAVRKETKIATEQEFKDGCFVENLEQY